MTNFLKKQKSFFKKTRLKPRFFIDRIKKNDILSFLFAFIFFAIINSLAYFTISNVSSSDDQWFYTKIAYLLRTEGFDAIKNFKGAYFTDLAQSGYSYAAGLYHYALIPFTLFQDKILGIKLSGLFFASLVPTICFMALRKLGVRYAFAFVCAFFYFLASSTFTFRLFLNRPFVLVDALVVWEMYLISERKKAAFFWVSLIHVWWHPATFWLPAILACCFEAVMVLRHNKIVFSNIIAGLAGSFGAFLLFPSHSHTFLSPLNPINFMGKLVGFINGLGNGPKIMEGIENYKGSIFEMIGQSSIMFLCLVFLIVFNTVLYLRRRGKSDDSSASENEKMLILAEYSFLVVIIFILGYVFSKRFEDILVPVTMLGIAVSFMAITERNYVQINSYVVKKIFAYSFILFLVVVGINRILDLRNVIGNDKSYLKYEKVGHWLQDNSKKDEIVFNTDFGQFNRLFFYDSWNRYIVGIEPKNMYENNPERYWLWHNIVLYGVPSGSGDFGRDKLQEIFKEKSENEKKSIMLENSKKISEVVVNDFQSRLIFIDGETILKKELDENKENFKLVYEDKEQSMFVFEVHD